MPRKHAPQIKDEEMYEALREQGNSAGKAARIANAHAAGTLHPRGGKLEGRTKDDLYREAQRIGIAGRSSMSKGELVKAIRDHG
ncbi:DUF7218 family protein [Sphingomonas sp. TX0543]|uniref:DUF7218 family protein n=1 Tax=unclassified Sphingomonas TaxID=196159 RepID=UPI0010F9EA6A|nr:Rho termination factor [Sphingomonas sp. 3P27F8]